MTKEDFTRRWRNHVAGLIALGTNECRNLLMGPVETAAMFGTIMNGLGATADELLGKLYDDLTPRPQQGIVPQAPANGQVKPAVPVQPQPVKR